MRYMIDRTTSRLAWSIAGLTTLAGRLRVEVAT
jgi:hypothetical protein